MDFHHVSSSDGSVVAPSVPVSSPSPSPLLKHRCRDSFTVVPSSLITIWLPFLPIFANEDLMMETWEHSIVYRRSGKWVAKFCFDLVSPKYVSIRFYASAVESMLAPYLNSNVVFRWGCYYEIFSFVLNYTTMLQAGRLRVRYPMRWISKFS
jgi:hypothetical protein